MLPGMLTQSLLKAPVESKVENQIESLAALTTMQSLDAKRSQARAGVEGVFPGTGVQSLLNTPLELKEAAQIESFEARTTI